MKLSYYTKKQPENFIVLRLLNLGAIFLQVTNSLALFLNYDFIIYEFLINFNSSMEKNVEI